MNLEFVSLSCRSGAVVSSVQERPIMPIPAGPLRRGDRGDAVAQLHRTLEAINRATEPRERHERVFGEEGVLRKLPEQESDPLVNCSVS
jgi:hypothetical protein